MLGSSSEVQQYATASFHTSDVTPNLTSLRDNPRTQQNNTAAADFAFHQFSTLQRTFNVAEASCREPQTRDMAAAAVHSELAVLLVDAAEGITSQTAKHACLVQTLGVCKVILAVNKMDLVGYAQPPFADIAASFDDIAKKLGTDSVTAIPISALQPENITEQSDVMPWYDGPTLLQHLEAVDADTHAANKGFRMAVQSVESANEALPTIAGRILSGNAVGGDGVVILPSARTSRVADVRSGTKGSEPVGPGDAAMMRLADGIEAVPGDIICAAKDRPMVADQFSVNLLWLDDEPLLAGRSYNIEMAGQVAVAHVSRIKHKIDPDTLDARPARKLNADDVALCNLSISRRLVVEPSDVNRALGTFILLDRTTNELAGAGTIEHVLYRSQNIHLQNIDISKRNRSEIKGHDSCCIWFTGLSGSGKSTIANALERQLHARGAHTYILDGDNVRHGLNRDLGFTDGDRVENVRRVTEVAKLMVDAGLIVVVSFISPFAAERQAARERFADGEFIEVFVDTPLEVCEARDAKGLYAKARAGEIPNFTGISSPYEPPEAAEMALAGDNAEPDALADQIIDELERKGRLYMD